MKVIEQRYRMDDVLIQSRSLSQERVEEQQRIGHFIFVTIAFTAILSLHFFLRPLRPWPDQGWMLQAAIRHSNGEGLTTQLSNDSLDLTRPAFGRLTYFPPGYPLLISTMIRCGFEVETAVKIVNLTALIIGVVGWLFLALPLLEGLSLRIVYCALLVLACGAVIPKGGTVDLLFWAGIPWWLSCVARARTSQGHSIALLLGAALTTAALILVRWAAVVLVPVAILAFMIPLARGRRELTRSILAAVMLALPPTFVYLAIGAINRYYSPNANYLSFVKAGWRPQYLLTLYPLQALFALPLGLEPLLDRGWRSVDPAMSALPGIVIFRLIIPLILLLSILIFVRQSGGIGSLPRITGSALLVVSLAAVGLIGFLAWMALRYNWEFINWSYLSEPRYYRPFLPAFLLAWLILVNRFRSRRLLWRTAITLFACSSIYLLQATARTELSLLRTHDESLEVVSKVRTLTTNPGINVVFDIDISDYLIHPESGLIASNYIEERDLPRFQIGQPATLWFVRRVHEISAYEPDRDRDRRRFEAHRQRFGSELAWTSSEGNYEIYKTEVR